MFAHGTLELQAEWVLAQVPIEAQSEAARHCTVGSFAQVPITSGQPPAGVGVPVAFTVHEPPVLQVPAKVQSVLTLHDFPGVPLPHLPLPMPLHCPLFVHAVVPLSQKSLQKPSFTAHCALEPQALPAGVVQVPDLIGQVAAV